MDQPAKITVKRASYGGKELAVHDASDIAIIHARRKESILEIAHAFEDTLTTVNKNIWRLSSIRHAR